MSRPRRKPRRWSKLAKWSPRRSVKTTDRLQKRRG
ncbi:unnamed protein product [Arabidopsis halleri]